MILIADTDTLVSFCRRLEGASYVAVDTEFMRERTYWPKLCVVQVAGGDLGAEADSHAAAIDALAPNIDLAPLFSLLENPRILKVFHAGRQDMEIFWHLRGRLPAPIFDTQIAAMVCGFGDSVSYETLVAKLAKEHVDKSSRFTDWAARPLSARQIAYAIADVVHLRVVYEKLQRRLHENGRETWLAEEMAVLTDPATYAVDPNLAWRRLKVRAKRRVLGVLREVAAWREREAQRLDLPRNRVLRDESVVEIAHHAPSTVAELARTRGMGARMAEGPAGANILKAVAAGLALPESECPEPEDREELPQGLGPVIELLKVLLKMKSEETGVAQKLIGSVADLERLAAFGEEAGVPMLHGWRREAFGADALKLRHGEIGLAVKGKKLRVVPAASGT